MYEYFAEVLRVIDADTIKARIDLGMNTYTVESVRFFNIDAPERHTPAGARATVYVAAHLPPGRKLKIKSHGLDQYGRWLADIYIDPVTQTSYDGGISANPDPLTYSSQSQLATEYSVDFSQQLVAANHAQPR